ncbi:MULTISPECIES: DNA adenine methylase [unclassified Ruminococcus]|uniref:DNA adenine methylase n=1 Tax=unclassified Ruminococcus TaxID=2608920 RepID=UPI00210EB981|nr:MULTISPECIES: DNA adenine methylase [unclassified Ruminococcus]MCQ4022037.1 Dam family site-specific DNA-(adenine-N6)-methyltransferase [Ruminococcus sp. zg-924]MCQ4114357.1 Dam family site-specific DNA-(adenine-N6)-methyltransferase [Ruminococcus sp. zg-921]
MFQPVIKWSGSKRTQAEIICSFLPDKFDTYFEPFIGGGSMLYAINPSKGICGDVCEPLISLWNKIKNSPAELAEEYRLRWERLQKNGYEVYYEIRNDYNKTHNPEDLLFLSRTCVNGLIRFNSNGDFNNSFHHTRKGIEPGKLKGIINDWSSRIQTATFIASDYEETTAAATDKDLVYLDPPYFHTKGRYYGTIDFDRFLAYLESLNSRKIKYILSFDGIRGDNDYTVELPKELYKRHEFISSGNSSFKKVMDGERQQVYESLYLNW